MTPTSPATQPMEKGRVCIAHLDLSASPHLFTQWDVTQVGPAGGPEHVDAPHVPVEGVPLR